MRHLPHSHFVDHIKPKLVEILYRINKPASARSVFHRIPKAHIRKHFTIQEIEELLLADDRIDIHDGTGTLKFSTRWEPEADRDISWRRK